MKFTSLFSALALVLVAGCASDQATNATNPWASPEDRAEGKAAKAAAIHEEKQAKEDAVAAKVDAAAVLPPVSKLPYSFIKKADEAPKVEEAPPALDPNRARIVAVRADAGLIQIKRSEPANPGDKFVITKDGKSLLIIVSRVDGEAIIADIAPKQVNVPAILVGDELPCVPPVEKPDEKK